MKYEGISFNSQWVKERTLKEFLSEVRANKHWWPNDPNRIDKAKALYLLLVPVTTKAGGDEPPASLNDDVHGASE